MREIEKKIINSLNKGYIINLSERDRIEDNIYILWNSEIFKINDDDSIEFSLCSWNTTTTKGRINALLSEFGGGHIFTKNFDPYYKSKSGKITKISSTEKYKVINGELMAA